MRAKEQASEYLLVFQQAPSRVSLPIGDSDIALISTLASMIDVYFTIAESAQFEMKEKGSRFLGYSFFMEYSNQLQHILQDLRSLHPKASHICFAYEVGLDGQDYRVNDDGEPSGSAGKPILGQIHSFGLKNVLVCVVRYFGGTKLGVPGLISSYKTTAFETLKASGKKEVYLTSLFDISVPFEHLGQTVQFLKNAGFNLLHQSYDTEALLKVEIRKNVEGEAMQKFKSSILGYDKSDEEMCTTVGYCTISRSN